MMQHFTSGDVTKRTESRSLEGMTSCSKQQYTIAERWKHPKCSLMDECLNKRNPMHSVECYSTLKRSDNLTHAATWMDLKVLC